MGEQPSPLKTVLKGLVGVIAWGLIAFGISYIGFGIFNDLNWGAPWACPGPFYTATNVLECLQPTTFAVEIPIGGLLLGLGIVLMLVDKMVLQKE